MLLVGAADSVALPVARMVVPQHKKALPANGIFAMLIKQLTDRFG
jgi:hypothetical protein